MHSHTYVYTFSHIHTFLPGVCSLRQRFCARRTLGPIFLPHHHLLVNNASSLPTPCSPPLPQLYLRSKGCVPHQLSRQGTTAYDMESWCGRVWTYHRHPNLHGDSTNAPFTKAPISVATNPQHPSTLPSSSSELFSDWGQRSHHLRRQRSHHLRRRRLSVKTLTPPYDCGAFPDCTKAPTHLRLLSGNVGACASALPSSSSPFCRQGTTWPHPSRHSYLNRTGPSI